MNKYNRIIFCLLLSVAFCMPFIKPIQVHAQESTYIITDFISIGEKSYKTSLPVRVVRLAPTSLSDSQLSFLYFVYDSPFSCTRTSNGDTYTNDAVLLDGYYLWKDGSGSYDSPSPFVTRFTDDDCYTGNYEHVAVEYAYGSKSVAPTPAIKIGQLKDIEYKVNRTATLENSTDFISWNGSEDSAGNAISHSAEWTVEVQAFAGTYEAKSKEDWWNMTGFQLLSDNSPVATWSTDAFNGSIEIPWNDVIGRWQYGRLWYNFEINSKSNYESHAWYYKIHLVYKDQKSDWMTVYPFVSSGTRGDNMTALSTSVYNTSTYNVLNQIQIITTSSDNSTTTNPVVYNYEYNTDNPTPSVIKGTSNPANIVPSDTTLDSSKGFLDRIIDFFNNIIGVALLPSFFLAKCGDFWLKLGFLSTCIAQIPTMFGILVANMSTHQEAILKWNDVSLLGSTLIPAGSMSLDSVVQQSGMETLHTFCKLALDAGLFIFLSFKIYDKCKELMKY